MSLLRFLFLLGIAFQWFKSRRPDIISGCISAAYFLYKSSLPNSLPIYTIIAALSLSTNLKKSKPKYRLCKLNDHNGDLTKWWYIEFYVHNEATGKVERQRVSGSKLNSLKKPVERYAYAKAEMASIDENLLNGMVINQAPKVKAEVQRIAADINLLEAIDICITAKKGQGRSEETIKGYQRIRRYLADYFPKVQKSSIAKITTEEVIQFFEKLQKERVLDGKTFNNYRSNLSSVFNYFIRLGKIRFNPAVSVERQVEKRGHLHVPYTSEQINQIYDHCRAKGDVQFILFSKILFYCLCRPDEVRNLRVSDINGKKIFFDPELNKNKRGRWNTLFPSLLKEIEEQKITTYPASFYIFGPNGKPGPEPVGEGRFYKRNLKILEALGMKGQKHTLYAFKHSGACAFYMAKFTVRQIMEIAGHTNESTTYKYLINLGLFSSIDGMEDQAPVI
jgi:integrase